MEKLSIDIIDPKVKPLLKELENLGLIKIDDDHIQAQKLALMEKLAGINLKDVDFSEIDLQK